jgi:epsin
LDYCLHAGSENVVIYFRDNVYLVKTLKEFQYVDEYGKDQGANVRQKAKDITNLLQDESRLRQERRSRANMRDRMTKGGTSNDNDEPTVSTSTSTSTNGAAERDKRKAPRKDDEEIKRALEASKQSYEREQLRTAEYVTR